jgi:hypothetical protein
MPSSRTLGSAGFLTVLAALLTQLSLFWSGPANAVPSFAQQTGQPCEACHVGAFGPQLKPYGRDFKLFGYQNSDKKDHELDVALTMLTSFTRTNANQTPPPAPGFGQNDNAAIDQASIFYAGKAPLGFGVFAQGTYSGTDRTFMLDNVDVRRAGEYDLLGQDVVGGLDFNNNPTVEDVWNSTPAWGFPYSASALAPAANAAPLIDGALAGQVVGAGGYALVNNTLYAELAAYEPLPTRVADWLGEGPTDVYHGALPYWRLALLHDFGAGPTQTVEFGAYGIEGQRYPGGVASAGTDRFEDWALDANYQYIGSARNVISAHATYIHEDQTLAASSVLYGVRREDTLTTAQADVSYSYDNTWTPSLQVFSTTGSPNPVYYGGGADTSGYIAELAWSPFGKPDSPIYWGNARVAVQYVGYETFNGARRGASDNNTLYLNVWIALAPFGSKVVR